MNTSPITARLDRVAARAAERMIRAYQRWLSPLKGQGRACAHRVMHGEESCSQHARVLLGEVGVRAAWPRIVARFAACQEAAYALDSTAHAAPAPHGRGRRWRRGACCIVIPLPGCSTTRTIR